MAKGRNLPLSFFPASFASYSASYTRFPPRNFSSGRNPRLFCEEVRVSRDQESGVHAKKGSPVKEQTVQAIKLLRIAVPDTVPFVCAMGLMYFIAKMACLLFGVFSSFKAIESGVQKHISAWVTFWIVMSVITVVEFATDLLFSWWLPYYENLKTVVMLYMMFYAPTGAQVAYKQLIRKRFARATRRIDVLAETPLFETISLFYDAFDRAISNASSKVLLETDQGPAQKNRRSSKSRNSEKFN